MSATNNPRPLSAVNVELGLYYLRAGNGCSSLGFDYADKQLRAVATWLGRPDLAPSTLVKGTEAHLAAYQATMAAGAEHHKQTGELCPDDLTPALVSLVGRRVEVTDQDGTRRRFWVGKSTGWMPVHLEIHNRRSTGGCAVYLPETSTVRVVSNEHR